MHGRCTCMDVEWCQHVWLHRMPTQQDKQATYLSGRSPQQAHRMVLLDKSEPYRHSCALVLHRLVKMAAG